jgi:hypothetical protein
MSISITDTPFARLESEGRLLNSVLKAATHKPGRFGFRGDVALKFQVKKADEARPPETCIEQVVAAANVGDKQIPFLCGFLLSFEYLQMVVDVLGDVLSPTGKYFFFCDNVDLASRYEVELGGANFYILPIDEATVYNEMLDLLYLEKTVLKKLDTAGKTDAIADKAVNFKTSYQKISFDEGVKRMGPVRNPYENRPV